MEIRRFRKESSKPSTLKVCFKGLKCKLEVSVRKEVTFIGFLEKNLEH
jgi:hypothetical protein